MTHTYQITGITCSGCINTIKNALYRIPGINQIDIEQATGLTTITMEKHVGTGTMQKALENTKYIITESGTQTMAGMQADKSTLKTYLPVLLLFGIITLATLVIQFNQPVFNYRHWMMHFMAGFFLSFSFFKLIDVPAFATGFSTYDLVAAHFKPWGYMYPFVELGLGITMLVPALWFEVNITALMISLIGSIGVIRSLMTKNNIQCACLGTVFNLPLGTVSLLENLLMAVMSAWVLFS